MTARPWISGRDYTWRTPGFSSEGLTSAEISQPERRSHIFRHSNQGNTSMRALLIRHADSSWPPPPARPRPTTPPRSNHSQAGAAAPAFTVREADGKPFRFEPKKLSKPTMLIFYRGGWCPYCNAHLKDLRTAVPQVAALGLRRVVPQHRPSRDPALEPQGARRLPPVVRQRGECRARLRRRLPHGRCHLRQVQRPTASISRKLRARSITSCRCPRCSSSTARARSGSRMPTATTRSACRRPTS